MILSIVTTAALVAFLALVVIYVKEREQTRATLAKYSGVLDLEAERERMADENARQREEHAKSVATYREAEAQEGRRRDQLSSEYQAARRRYEELQTELALVEESLEDISFGVYKPHFTYQSPEEYKAKIELLRKKQRDMVRQGEAAQCSIPWTVNNSKVEGKRMIRLHSKLMLRAFNGECEGAIANVDWHNAQKMDGRIRKAFFDVNKLGDVQKISIADQYLALKIDELRMVYEYEQKRYELREEQRRIREQMREEERTQKEIEKVIEESTTEEEKFAAAIAKARDDATRAMGEKLERLTAQISTFEAKLDEARKKKERAIARAQFTKTGFVYVISNIGSFGERVFKIGMTRRLEPMDRIYELSGAAVPFPYDLHAMLYSDDAPALELDLHRLFRDRRLNRVNARREFFQDVDLEEIESYVRTKGLSAQFLRIPEAREYRETVALRANVTDVKAAAERQKHFPEKLF